MKCAFITENKGSYPIKMMCRLLGISRSCYYKSLTATPGPRKERREELAAQIKEIHEEERHIPGQRKIYVRLLRLGERCSLGLVRRICQECGICSCTLKSKKFKVCTTDSKHSNRISPNELGRNFNATKLNEIWLADITYVETKEGFVYVSVIIDLYSRRVIGVVVSEEMKAQLVVDTLKQALRTRRGVLPKEVLFHSDRGVQYTAEEFRELLRRFGITQSTSRKGNCWDNAPCESFWGKLKREWLNRFGVFENIDQVRKAVFEYVEGYYYNQRLHAGLGYRTPREVEEEYFANH